jgi:hypothetical protein
MISLIAREVSPVVVGRDRQPVGKDVVDAVGSVRRAINQHHGKSDRPYRLHRR